MASRFTKLQHREVDHEAATKTGVRVDFDDDVAPFWIRVRQHGGANRRSMYLASSLFVEHAVEEMGPADRAQAIRSIEVEVISRELISDWGGPGLEDEDGQRIEPTAEAIVELMERFPDVCSEVLNVSQDEERYRVSATCKSD